MFLFRFSSPWHATQLAILAVCTSTLRGKINVNVLLRWFSQFCINFDCRPSMEVIFRLSERMLQPMSISKHVIIILFLSDKEKYSILIYVS